MTVKKVFLLMILCTLILCAALSLNACDPQKLYADLVAVRINGRMAEWNDSSFNFSYEGDPSLVVCVPYTNYLQISDLILSPGAEGKVFSDKEFSREITDTDNIRVDGDTELFIRVSNDNLSHDYKVLVKISNENLPDIDLSAKDYDNRGGHIYIPENAETVTVDGVEFQVLRGNVDTYESPYFESLSIKSDTNYILANDIWYRDRGGYNKQSGLYDLKNVFDGNGYTITCSKDAGEFIYKITQAGVVKNFTFTRDTSSNGVINSYSVNNYGFVATYNEGTIDNVFVAADHTLKYVDTVYDPSEKDGFKLVKASQYVFENNGGTIKNCIHYGALRNVLDERYCVEMGVFTTYANSGTIRNCVNKGVLEGRPQDMESPNGSFIIGYSVGKDLSIEGCYNLGDVETPTEWNKYNGFFGVISAGATADITQTKNYKN